MRRKSGLSGAHARSGFRGSAAAGEVGVVEGEEERREEQGAMGKMAPSKTGMSRQEAECSCRSREKCTLRPGRRGM